MSGIWGGVDGLAPQAVEGLPGMGVAGQEAVPLPAGMDKPKFWKSSTQALSPWRDWEESPESSTASPAGGQGGHGQEEGGLGPVPLHRGVLGAVRLAPRHVPALLCGEGGDAELGHGLKGEVYITFRLQRSGEEDVAVPGEQGQGQQQPGDELGADVPRHLVRAGGELPGDGEGQGIVPRVTVGHPVVGEQVPVHIQGALGQAGRCR